MKKYNGKITIVFLCLIMISSSFSRISAEETLDENNNSTLVETETELLEGEDKLSEYTSIIDSASIYANGNRGEEKTTVLTLHLPYYEDLLGEDIHTAENIEIIDIQKVTTNTFNVYMDGDWMDGEIAIINVFGESEGYDLNLDYTNLEVCLSNYFENEEDILINNVSITDDNVIKNRNEESDLEFNEDTGLLTVSSNAIYDTYSLKTSNIIDMEKITHIHFEEGAKAYKFGSRFFSGEYLPNLEYITGKLDTSEVEDMMYLFSGSPVKSIEGIEDWDISKVTSLYSTFANMTNIKSLNLENWDTSNVTNMQLTFGVSEGNESSLEEINIKNWDTSQVTSFQSMFLRSSLKNLDLNHFGLSNAEVLDYMFYHTNNLETLLVNQWDTSNVSSMMLTFSDTSVSNLNIASWDVSNVIDMTAMFRGAYNLEYINIQDWDVSSVEMMAHMFAEMKKLVYFEAEDWDIRNVTTIRGMFMINPNLIEVEVGSWDLSNVTDIANLFIFDHKIEKVDVGQWDTSNVSKYNAAFSYTYYLKNIDISNWDTVNNDSTEHMDLKALFRGIYPEKIILGPYSVFNKSTLLNPINRERGKYTGRWVQSNPNEPKVIYNSSDDFMDQYDGTTPGKYVWQEAKISDIHYNLNGGTNSESNPITYYEEFGTQDLAEPTRKDHTFVKWMDESGETITKISETTTGNVTLSAVWEHNPLIITYVSAIANGLSQETKTSKITLIFSEDIGDFNIDDIELSNEAVVKDSLSRISDGVYELMISGNWLNGTSLNVTVHSPQQVNRMLEYIIVTPDTQSVILYNLPHYTITAEDAIIGLQQAKRIQTDSDLKKLNNVEGLMYPTRENVDVVIVLNEFEAREGVYSMEYAINADNTTKTTTTIEVLAQDKANNEDIYVIAGNDLIITKHEVPDFLDKDLVDSMEVIGWNKQTLEEVNITLVSQSLQEEVGIYDIIFKIENTDVELVLEIEVIPEDKVSYNKDYVLAGNNFSIIDEDVDSLSDDDIKNLSSIRSWNRNTKETLDVEVIDNTLDSLEGEYEITFKTTVDTITRSSEDIELSVEAKVTSSPIPTEDEYQITAENFAITVSEAENLTYEDILQKSKAQGWNITQESEVEVEVVSSLVEAEEGTYTIILGLEDTDVQRNIVSYVVDKDIVVESKEFALAANNASINLEEAKDITNEKLISITGAYGWNKETGESIEIEVISHSIIDEIGIYEVIFKGKDTDLEIKSFIEVYDSKDEDPNNELTDNNNNNNDNSDYNNNTFNTEDSTTYKLPSTGKTMNILSLELVSLGGLMLVMNIKKKRERRD